MIEYVAGFNVLVIKLTVPDANAPDPKTVEPSLNKTVPLAGPPLTATVAVKVMVVP